MYGSFDVKALNSKSETPRGKKDRAHCFIPNAIFVNVCSAHVMFCLLKVLLKLFTEVEVYYLQMPPNSVTAKKRPKRGEGVYTHTQ